MQKDYTFKFYFNHWRWFRVNVFSLDYTLVDSLLFRRHWTKHKLLFCLRTFYFSAIFFPKQEVVVFQNFKVTINVALHVKKFAEQVQIFIHIVGCFVWQFYNPGFQVGLYFYKSRKWFFWESGTPLRYSLLKELY